MVDFKAMNLESLGGLVTLGLILLVVVGVVMTVLGPLLTIALPNVFGGGIGLTDALLLLILIRLHTN